MLTGSISTWRPISELPPEGTEVDLWFGDRKPPIRLIDCKLHKGEWMKDDDIPSGYGQPTDWMPTTSPSKVVSGPIADLENAVSGLAGIIDLFDNAIRTVEGNPDTTTVSFGLGFQGGIPFLAQASSTLNVSLTWNKPVSKP